MDWYLFRTRRGKEWSAASVLTKILPEVFLPLLGTGVRQRGRTVESVEALFPGCCFGRFYLQSEHLDLGSASGLNSRLLDYREPVLVPPRVIEEIRSRQVNGLVKIQPRVQIVSGSPTGLESIFSRRLSGTERVAMLLCEIQKK
jgi:hypothetical protein